MYDSYRPESALRGTMDSYRPQSTHRPHVSPQPSTSQELAAPTAPAAMRSAISTPLHQAAKPPEAEDETSYLLAMFEAHARKVLATASLQTLEKELDKQRANMKRKYPTAKEQQGYLWSSAVADMKDASSKADQARSEVCSAQEAFTKRVNEYSHVRNDRERGLPVVSQLQKNLEEAQKLNEALTIAHKRLGAQFDEIRKDMIQLRSQPSQHDSLIRAQASHESKISNRIADVLRAAEEHENQTKLAVGQLSIEIGNQKKGLMDARSKLDALESKVDAQLESIDRIKSLAATHSSTQLNVRQLESNLLEQTQKTQAGLTMLEMRVSDKLEAKLLSVENDAGRALRATVKHEAELAETRVINQDGTHKQTNTSADLENLRQMQEDLRACKMFLERLEGQLGVSEKEVFSEHSVPAWGAIDHICTLFEEQMDDFQASINTLESRLAGLEKTDTGRKPQNSDKLSGAEAVTDVASLMTAPDAQIQSKKVERVEIESRDATNQISVLRQQMHRLETQLHTHREESTQIKVMRQEMNEFKKLIPGKPITADQVDAWRLQIDAFGIQIQALETRLPSFAHKESVDVQVNALKALTESIHQMKAQGAQHQKELANLGTAIRFLEDKYCFTSSKTVVDAMLRTMHAMYPYSPGAVESLQRDVNELKKVQSSSAAVANPANNKANEDAQKSAQDIERQNVILKAIKDLSDLIETEVTRLEERHDKGEAKYFIEHSNLSRRLNEVEKSKASLEHPVKSHQSEALGSDQVKGLSQKVESLNERVAQQQYKLDAAQAAQHELSCQLEEHDKVLKQLGNRPTPPSNTGIRIRGSAAANVEGLASELKRKLEQSPVASETRESKSRERLSGSSFLQKKRIRTSRGSSEDSASSE